MSFTIFQNEKTPFQAIKTKSSKSRKIDIFVKGLTHGFGAKMAIFPPFSFQAIQARKMSFTIFQNEKTPFEAIKTISSKSGKIDIFAKGLTHGFSPKMTIFPTFFFQAIIYTINESRNILFYFRLFKLVVFIAQKGVFSFQNIVKDIFLAYIS